MKEGTKNDHFGEKKKLEWKVRKMTILEDKKLPFWRRQKYLEWKVQKKLPFWRKISGVEGTKKDHLGGSGMQAF